MLARIIAPAILGLCAGALLWLAKGYYQAGHRGKAFWDVLGAVALIAAAIGLSS